MPAYRHPCRPSVQRCVRSLSACRNLRMPSILLLAMVPRKACPLQILPNGPARLSLGDGHDLAGASNGSLISEGNAKPPGLSVARRPPKAHLRSDSPPCARLIRARLGH